MTLWLIYNWTALLMIVFVSSPTHRPQHGYIYLPQFVRLGILRRILKINLMPVSERYLDTDTEAAWLILLRRILCHLHLPNLNALYVISKACMQ